MKLAALIFCLSGFAWNTFAKPIPKPCFECTNLQKEIFEGFQLAGPVEELSEPTVFSGECVWEGYGHSPERVQHGVAFLEPKGEIVYYGGRFSFFKGSNPYGDWSPDRAREELPNLYEDDHMLIHFEDYSFVDFSGENADQIVRYWFRLADATLFIVGQWGLGNRALCELRANEID